MVTTEALAQAEFRETSYDGPTLLEQLRAAVDTFRLTHDQKLAMLRACRHLVKALEKCEGNTLQARWLTFECTVWQRWNRGEGRPPDSRRFWTWGARAIVMARLIRPSRGWLADTRVSDWVASLPEADPLLIERDRLAAALASLHYVSKYAQKNALYTGLRVLLVEGYLSLDDICEADLRVTQKGDIALDAALCTLGIFDRTPRNHARGKHSQRLTVAELVVATNIPAPFQQVTRLYFEAYAVRISDNFRTLHTKITCLGHFWNFMTERFPEVTSSADILPCHAQAYIPYAMERGLKVQRGKHSGQQHRLTSHQWISEARCFFHDLMSWALDPGSPLASYAPRALPLTRFDLRGIGYEKARTRRDNAITATILDLEREMPKLRAFAYKTWQDAAEKLVAIPDDPTLIWKERTTFWDWALLELLVQSGVRIEEASQLTTLDVLRRRLSDGRLYYLLHIKPSKNERARVIPIGDGLGRVIAEIIRHVKAFYNTSCVPFVDH